MRSDNQYYDILNPQRQKMARMKGKVKGQIGGELRKMMKSFKFFSNADN